MLRVNGEIVTRDSIADEICNSAKSQIGVREQGYNDGPQIREYQKAVDGKAQKESYCMGFVQWNAKRIAAKYGLKNPMFPSELCTAVWDHTPAKYRLKPGQAIRGSVFIQKVRGNSIKGHTGINTGSGSVQWPTIEGNTDASGSREGDGVYATTRMVTGTATKEVLGHIDIAQMIYDQLALAVGVTQPEPVIIPVEQTNPFKPNVKGDWNPDLDNVIMNMVTPELLALPYSRMKKFMPGWDTMNQTQRKRFFADLLFAMAEPESNYNAKVMYWEKDLGTDAVTGLPVVSEGLLQMSYQDKKFYPGIAFDYAKDAELFKADWAARRGRNSWKSIYPGRTTLNPEINVRAAMIVFIKLLTNPKLANIEFADTIGRYWSCMRRYKSGIFNSTYRDSFLTICKTLKQKGYRT